MRVELPQPQSPQSPPPVAMAATGAGTRGDYSPTTPLRRTAHERWVRAVTGWRVVLPTLALCVASLAWSLLFREAQGRKAMIVMARSTPPDRSTNTPVTGESLATLKEQQIARSASLIRERKEIAHLLAQLETRAHELGLGYEHVIKPAVVAPFGITNLTLHPVSLRLSVEENAGFTPFHRFTDWLHTVSSLPIRSEITQLDLQTEARGLGTAILTLHFYSGNNHAEAFTK